MNNIAKGFIALALVGGAFAGGIVQHHITSTTTDEICITEKYRDMAQKADTSDASKEDIKSTWIVVGKYAGTQEFEVFHNKDSYYPWKRNSSTLQAHLELYECYHLNVNSVRSSWLSWYRNILSIEV